MNKVLKAASMIFFTGMALCVLFQVISRYVLSMPLPWTEEAARYFFIWATFLGAAVAFATNEHLSVKVLLSNLPNDHLRGLIALTGDLCCLCFLGTFVFDGLNLTMTIFEVGQTPPSMDFLQMGWVYLAIPLGSALMILNIIPYALNHLEMMLKGEEKTSNPSQEKV